MNAMTDVPQTRTRTDPDEVCIYDARDLVKGGVRALIRLDDQVYCLRITRAGKLILTK